MAEHHDVEVHLATCPQCAGELAQYREVLHAVSTLRDELEPVPTGLTDRILLSIPEPEWRWSERALRVARDRRLHVAVASLGGAVVGAGAIALIWRRAARRGLARTA